TNTFIPSLPTLVLFVATCLFPAWLLAATHNVMLSAETLPNGQLAYRLVNHTGSDGAVPCYPVEATIPGPTLFIKKGDSINVQLTINTDVPVGFNVSSLSVGNAAPTAPGQTRRYRLNASQAGTHPYQDGESALLGLFGAIVVHESDGTVQSFVEGDGTIVTANRSQLDREFVLFMIGSTFWGSEITPDGTQRPLWTNPDLGAYQDDLVRFHVLAIGPGHTCHLHAHRWIDPGSSQKAPAHIIDTHLL